MLPADDGGGGERQERAEADWARAREAVSEGARWARRALGEARGVLRPSELGSHTSGGSAFLNSSMICANSAARSAPSLTAFLEQQSDVAPRPDCESAFQIAPLEPPSTRLNSSISR